MARVESQPVIKKESLLERAGKFIFKILGIGVLIGAAYSGLKEIVIPGLNNVIGKVKKFVKS